MRRGRADAPIGDAGTTPPDRGRRPGERRSNAGHRDVEQPAPAGLECLDASSRRGQSGERIGDGIAAEHGTAIRPCDEPARDGGVVTESDTSSSLTAAAVGGDGDPEPRSADQHVGSDDAELLEGAWPAGFDDDIGRAHETSQQFALAGIV